MTENYTMIYKRFVINCISGRSRPCQPFCRSNGVKAFRARWDFWLQYFKWPPEKNHRSAILPVRASSSYDTAMQKTHWSSR